ncbi:DUF1178 family protein [Novosphingobium sp. JCM 18896]|uniref:DUF1178 family protein n=1 Tax=Novosphingobium sp. JCM 18896 TaxID=2989731 RepID=UPI0022234B8A|nr:DUF1178 family protein [Novosphingobium sp. JCM 18896]MCW1428500.1 DUF1178 family protein [Novosphingobium sp. JCM 18896]
MIVFDLECRAAGHRFEGWFGSSGDFSEQQARGLVSCPECGSAEVIKAPMAPNLARKGNQLVSAPAAAPSATPAAASPQQPMTKAPMPPEAIQLIHALHAMQAEALKDSRWVGDKFAEESRAIHYGERDAEIIHGQATREEAEALLEEGIEVAPLPFPIAPPGEAN